MLPDAPPTESSASTSGTPAANMVDSVRSHRAMVALRITGPKIGSLSISLSMKNCTAGDRFQACIRKYKTPPVTPKIRYQFSTKKSDIAITTSVGMGRSAPKLENTLLNAGITNSMITATTIPATPITATG